MNYQDYEDAQIKRHKKKSKKKNTGGMLFVQQKALLCFSIKTATIIIHYYAFPYEMRTLSEDAWMQKMKDKYNAGALYKGSAICLFINRSELDTTELGDIIQYNKLNGKGWTQYDENKVTRAETKPTYRLRVQIANGEWFTAAISDRNESEAIAALKLQFKETLDYFKKQFKKLSIPDAIITAFINAPEDQTSSGNHWMYRYTTKNESSRWNKNDSYFFSKQSPQK